MNILHLFSLHQVKFSVQTQGKWLLQRIKGLLDEKKERRALRQGLRNVFEGVVVFGFVMTVILGLLLLEATIVNEPLNTPQQWIAFIQESASLGTVESVSIITAVGIFLKRGRQQEKLREQDAALAILKAHGIEHSYPPIRALQDLNQNNFSFQKLNAKDADLRKVDLVGADLIESNLQNANLEEANLSEARLEFAELQNANLQRAKLCKAGLLDAHLQSAQLGGATLTQTILKGANLQDATLQFANLADADLTGANLMRTDLTGINLTGANLQPQQVKRARNWQLALYDAALCQQLGLPIALPSRSPTTLAVGLARRATSTR
jgi:BTB/POZ domain-containing protein KCTD9